MFSKVLLKSLPNFLLAGISHHHTVSFKSDSEEHCPRPLALTRLIGYFSQELLGQHTHRLPTRLQTERKPKRSLSSFVFSPRPTLVSLEAQDRLQDRLQDKCSRRSLRSSRAAFRGGCCPQGTTDAPGGQGALGPHGTLK